MQPTHHPAPHRQSREARPGLRLPLVVVLAITFAAMLVEWALFAWLGVPGAAKAAPAPATVPAAAAAPAYPRHHDQYPQPRDHPRRAGETIKPDSFRVGEAEKPAETNSAPKVVQQPVFTNQHQWLEWMRKEKPKDYQNMVSNQANWRAIQLQQDEARLQELANLDVSHFSAAEREVHEAYQNVIARQAELRELLAWENEELLTDAEREAYQKEQGESWQVLNQCSIRERETLMREAARQLGLKKPAAEQLVQEMYEIFKATGFQLPQVMKVENNNGN